MADWLMEKIREIQKNIEKEKADEMDGLLMALAGLEEDQESEEQGEKKDYNYYNLVILTWLCLKAELECQALQNGRKELEEPFRVDIDEIFNYVRRYRYKQEISEDVIADAMDLILSIGSIRERDLQAYSTEYVAESVRTQREISVDMFYLFVSVAKRLLTFGEKETAYRLIERLCMLSRERNGIERHKDLVVQSMCMIFDSASSIICRILGMDEKIFSGDRTENAGDFYWFYACGLWQEKNMGAARIYFERCYSIRKDLYGEEHWATALAKRNVAVVEYYLKKSRPACENLLEFVVGIEEGKYTDMTMHEEVQAETIGFLLMLCQSDAVFELPVYEELIGRYEDFCNVYAGSGNEMISKRLAWNFRGIYHLQSGDYILAENAFQNALKEKAVSALSDEQIKINLLHTANIQNDSWNAENVLSTISEEELSETDYLRFYIGLINNYTQDGVELDGDELWEIKDFVRELCEEMIGEKESTDDRDCWAAVFLYAVVVYFLQNDYADVEEQELYLKALNIVEKDGLRYPLSGIQRKFVLLAEAFLTWNLGLPEAETLMNKLLAETVEEGLSGLPSIYSATVFLTAASYFGRKDKHHMAMDCVEKAMAGLTETWHGYVKYANDISLINIVFPIQHQFNVCYAIVRRFADVENAYDKVLRLKMLASLAGRERNRIAHSVEMDSELVREINALQDRLAELVTEELFQNHVAKIEKLEAEKRELELEFARKFPSGAEFKEINRSLVLEAIPDNSVVLEYYFAMNDFGQTQFEDHPDDDELWVLELYFIKKQNGKTSLRRFDIKNVETILDKAEQFILIYQEKSENSGVSPNDGSLEDLRYDLYEALIKPVIHEIGEGVTVYFAPDTYLLNLPLELLYEEERLEESHQIVKIECARDFLFNSPDNLSAKPGLVIGNPEYFVKEKEITEDGRRGFEQTRAIDMDLMEIGQLPFAEMEAQRVAGYFSTVPWLGREATKAKLLAAGGYQNLHITTHGVFDLSGETNAIYSSCLLFAGVKNWMQNSHFSSKYGNGIVTADEISRMNLKATKLVVLSSCLNGRSDTIFSKGFQGMVGAFAAAGVKYIIAHLWNAPETLGTVILMDRFYHYYMEENMEPPLALAKAKECLRNITIDKMREQGWFDFVRKSDLDFTSKRRLAELEKCNGRLKPYKDEIFWGGFSCYRCN